MSENDLGGLRDKTAPDPTAGEKFKERVGATQASNPSAMEERELWRGTYSSRAMMSNWVMAGILTVVLIGLVIWLFVIEFEWAMIALYAALALIAVMWVGSWILLVARQWSRHYRVTTQRIIHQEGVIHRTNDRIEIIDVHDVSFSQGIFDRMFGVGNIKICSDDQSHPELILEGIADADRVTNIIDDARRDERRRRGVRIVD